jgi:hypothetical protein
MATLPMPAGGDGLQHGTVHRVHAALRRLELRGALPVLHRAALHFAPEPSVDMKGGRVVRDAQHQDFSNVS